MYKYKDLKRNLKKNLKELPVLKVSLLGDTSTQFLSVALKGIAIERGYNLDLWEAGYSQIEHNILDTNSELYQHNAKYTIIFQSTHKLLERFNSLPLAERSKLADERIALINTLCSNIEGKIIYYNYPEIDDTVNGSYANNIDSSFTFQIRKLNYELMQLTQSNGSLYICDLASLQNKFGRDFMFDPSVYVATDMVLSIDSLPYVASRTFDLISSLEGKFNKCIILDLDNTLWGGVVGDDGWEKIQLGHGLGIGKAYTELQEWIKKLKDRGIIVCVCSKNDEQKAKEPFEKNPEMVLRLDDISVFVANWENKADNIRYIQKVLNIGFDSMVFIDDNPCERDMVRTALPQVKVPELPENPENFLEHLYSLNLFETTNSSKLDANRTKLYQTEEKRVKESLKFTSETDFLQSLNMVAEVADFTTFNCPRVSQLSQRSNQFNLRTVRFTEDQIMSLSKDERYKCFAFSLKDKYGDNGLVSVVILENRDDATVFIHTWFMSCRVLKRTMEAFILNKVAEWAKVNGYTKLIGEYIPTEKNKLVAGLYESLGFLKAEADNNWQLELLDYQPKPCYIAEK